MAIRYYVGYRVTAFGMTVDRGREITCPRPIRNMEDVFDLQHTVQQIERGGDVFVMAFSPLHDDEPATSTESDLRAVVVVLSSPVVAPETPGRCPSVRVRRGSARRGDDDNTTTTTIAPSNETR